VKSSSLLLALLLAGCTMSGVDTKASRADKGSLPDDWTPASLAGAGPVVVPEEVLDGWRFLYRFVTEVEFVLCLEGRRSGDQIYVEAFRLARMEAQNSSSVRYQPCTSDRYVGTAHNHPPVTANKSLCYQSMPDKRSFEADDRAMIDIVLCGEDRFLWVVRDGKDGPEQVGTAIAMTAGGSN
jgi:hypothetical protein